MTPPDRDPATQAFERFFNWKTCFLVTVVGVVLGLITAGAHLRLFVVAPILAAIYAFLFLTGTRFFQRLFSKLLFK